MLVHRITEFLFCAVLVLVLVWGGWLLAQQTVMQILQAQSALAASQQREQASTEKASAQQGLADKCGHDLAQCEQRASQCETRQRLREGQ